MGTRPRWLTVLLFRRFLSGTPFASLVSIHMELTYIDVHVLGIHGIAGRQSYYITLLLQSEHHTARPRPIYTHAVYETSAQDLIDRERDERESVHVYI